MNLQDIIDKRVARIKQREAADEIERLRTRAQRAPEVLGAARFLLERLDEFDPGEDDAEREYHGHVAPAIARLRAALTSKTRCRYPIRSTPKDHT